MKMNHGNGRDALADRLKRVEEAEKDCHDLAANLPPPMSLEHCSNKEAARPWYNYQNRIDRASLNTLSILAGCRADEVRATLLEYDSKPTQHGTQQAPDVDQCSELGFLKCKTFPGGVVSLKLQGKGSTTIGARVAKYGIAALVVAYLLVNAREATRTLNDLKAAVHFNGVASMDNNKLLRADMGLPISTNATNKNGGAM